MPREHVIKPNHLRTPLIWMSVLVLLAMMSTVLEARSGVAPEQALRDAESLTRSFSDWSIYRGDGDSMAPRFDERHLLLVKPARQGEVKAGMIALFHDAEGDLVAHTVIGLTAEGIITRGLNNRHHDPQAIPHGAIVGVLVGTLAANAPIPGSFDLPVALGKTY